VGRRGTARVLALSREVTLSFAGLKHQGARNRVTARCEERLQHRCERGAPVISKSNRLFLGTEYFFERRDQKDISVWLC
jgi:hypothetical protein